MHIAFFNLAAEHMFGYAAEEIIGKQRFAVLHEPTELQLRGAERNAAQSVPLGGTFWDGGAQTFLHKGENGRWRDVLEARDVADYERIAQRELGAECAAWLAQGA